MYIIFVSIVFSVATAVDECPNTVGRSESYNYSITDSAPGAFWWPGQSLPEDKSIGRWLQEKEDPVTSENMNPRCMETMDRSSKKKDLLWGYDTRLKKCIQYEYRKCGDFYSGNRFGSREDCENTCKYHDYGE